MNELRLTKEWIPERTIFNPYGRREIYKALLSHYRKEDGIYGDEDLVEFRRIMKSRLRVRAFEFGFCEQLERLGLSCRELELLPELLYFSDSPDCSYKFGRSGNENQLAFKKRLRALEGALLLIDRNPYVNDRDCLVEGEMHPNQLDISTLDANIVKQKNIKRG